MISNFKRKLKNNFPDIVHAAQDIRGVVRAACYKHVKKGKTGYVCPICRYSGPFMEHSSKICRIFSTKCPRCGLYERHRLQYLVMAELEKTFNYSKMSILHFAPEPAFEKLFSRKFAVHHTADISAEGVDFRIDICKIPFPDNSYDVIYASHVLEHVQQDDVALAEVNRVLKQGGMAILPVPVVSPHTIEYSEPNPFEFGHIRAVGLDYFNRYEKHFSKVEIWKSNDFDEKYQLYTYEDRSLYPSKNSPNRVPMDGDKHSDYVPVCFK